ncbi:hypothetical protein FSARC_10934 [Fusarium sarcochroum]|uniref:NADH:ubiquinone oxidoreductase intermediate-associated protein 30 domain-containing protein n=1 Tax=Fusarium sarcochroum TaxID=1208366 RepID=A0A8H4X1J9_9HYPO|nr:hypothetical protein FSARC_10934 [Fusarium sarcochroum]
MYLPSIARQAVSFLALFSPWDKSQWIASDDVVRGGISHSSLDILEPKTADNPFSHSIAKFHGTLDYVTLGGSGFASQRTIDDWPGLDLSGYDRLLVEISYTDGKTYTLNLKDNVVPPSKDGVEQPSVSWAYDFQIPATKKSKGEILINQVIINFKDLVPTLRGTVQNDTEPFDLANILRASIMIRSFQTEQEGEFELRIKSITALRQDCETPKIHNSCEDLCT